jgi:hypothetical protein
MLTVIGCPECEIPAEVTDRFVLPSSRGPIEHLAIRCAAGHHFRMPSDLLPLQARELLQGTTAPADLVCPGLPLTAVVRARPEGAEQ